MSPNENSAAPNLVRPATGSATEVLLVAFRLGLGSFGGPIAHLAYFERTYVQNRRWLTQDEYAGIVALCQALPGPASSQVGFLIGLHRAGWRGALAAWLGFTLPSALFMLACARLAAPPARAAADAALHGLKLVAVAVVAQAVMSMARKLCPDLRTAAIALFAGSLLLVGGAGVQLAALALGAAGGVLLCRRAGASTLSGAPGLPVSPAVGWTALGVFVLLLAGLPLAAALFPRSLAALAGIFFRAGALVFGGGHVVLPLLRDAMVPDGWISDDHFLTGYGLAQLLPGPLFTLAAYLGAANNYVHPPLLAALAATAFIFLPGLLLAVAGASLWGRASRYAAVRAAFTGTNAAVVGILGAALYDPLWTTAIHRPFDVAIAVTGFAMLQRWKVPPAAVVAFCVAASLVGVLAPAFA